MRINFVIAIFDGHVIRITGQLNDNSLVFDPHPGFKPTSVYIFSVERFSAKSERAKERLPNPAVKYRRKR